VKILIFLAETFEYQASERSSPLAGEPPQPAHDAVEDAIVAFIQCEPRDEDRGDAALKQAVKYFRWFARKRGVQRLVLHSFAHLGEERSSPEFARDLLAALGHPVRLEPEVVDQRAWAWLRQDLQVHLGISGVGYLGSE
jgi:hypothetical protein